ncbi:MAG: hypothetical protein ACREM3_15700 [Candidatus Rokuibacteriota bacterium]
MGSKKTPKGKKVVAVKDLAPNGAKSVTAGLYNVLPGSGAIVPSGGRSPRPA